MLRQRVTIVLIAAVSLGVALAAAFFIYTMYSDVSRLFWQKTNGSAPSVADDAASSTLVANPNGGYDIPSNQLTDCQSGKPVIDLEGNPSAAIESATNVYDAYCNLLIGATPSTFVALNYWYGKDSSTVWILQSPVDEPQSEAQAIEGADPATFTLIPNDNLDNSAMYPNEDFSLSYTKDKQHVYLNGFKTGLDPASFSLPPDS